MADVGTVGIVTAPSGLTGKPVEVGKPEEALQGVVSEDQVVLEGEEQDEPVTRKSVLGSIRDNAVIIGMLTGLAIGVGLAVANAGGISAVAGEKLFNHALGGVIGGGVIGWVIKEFS